ncbi:MAG: PPC domain-containing protein [Chloroflexi bacterium]|nr:PPC domain-containing protein [Chloroflexota bacterium]
MIRNSRVRAAAIGLAVLAAVLAAGAVAGSRRAGGGAPAPAQAGPPPNDNFAQAAQSGASPEINSVPMPWDYAQNTGGATLEAGESAPCAKIGATVWFIASAPAGATLYVTTAGSSFDTVLAAYTATDLAPSTPGKDLVPAGCDDNGGDATQAALALPAAPGKQYFIQVGGKDGATGDLKVRVVCQPGCPPENDNRDQEWGARPQALAQRSDVVARTDTSAATLEAGEPTDCGNVTRTIWYTYSGFSPTRLVIETAGSDVPTAIAVYRLEGPRTRPFGDATRLACATGDGSNAARMTVAAQPGEQLQIQIGGMDGAGGPLAVTFSCDPACPPPNDSLSPNPIIDRLEDRVATEGAGVDDGEPTTCGQIGRTVWYAVVLPGATDVTVDTAGSNFDTVIAVYEVTGYPASYDTLLERQCVAPGAGRRAKVTFPAEANRTYQVQVGGRAGAFGDLNALIECTPSPCPPLYDGTRNPPSLDVRGVSDRPVVSLDIRGATTEPGEPLDCGPMAKTTWYQIYADMEADLIIDTRDSDFSTALAVYSALPPSPQAQRLACDAPGAGGRARLAVHAHANQPLWLQAGAVAGEGGTLALSMSCAPACTPVNDNAVDAASMPPTSPDSGLGAYTQNATLEPGEPRPCADIGATVWYRFSTGEEAQRLVIRVMGQDFAAAAAVYRSTGGVPPAGLENIACGADGLEAALEPNSTYYIQFGGVAGAGGQLLITAYCSPLFCGSTPHPVLPDR